MWHPLPMNVHSLRIVSTLTITAHPPRCCERLRKACRRQALDKLANGREPREARLPAPHNRYRDGAAPPGFFWLFANGELVGDKPCAIARSILVGEW